MPTLVSKEGIEHKIELNEKPYFLIGRGRDNDLRLPDEYCSRFHAAVYRDSEDPAKLRLVNYSRNGTYVNDAELGDATITLSGGILDNIGVILMMIVNDPRKLNEVSKVLEDGDVIRFAVKEMEYTYRC